MAAALRAARALRQEAGARVLADFRSIDDPEAPVTTPRALQVPRPARSEAQARGKRRGRCDAEGRGDARPGSLQRLRPGRWRAPAGGARSGAACRAGCAHCARRPAARRARHPTRRSCARADSMSGRPLAVTGPQVAYYSPEILFEMDLHGGGRGHARRGLPRHQPLRAARPRQGLHLERHHGDHRQHGRVRRGALRAGRRRAHARLHPLPLQGPLRADDGAGARAAHARALGGRPGRGRAT